MEYRTLMKLMKLATLTHLRTKTNWMKWMEYLKPDEIYEIDQNEGIYVICEVRNRN